MHPDNIARAVANYEEIQAVPAGKRLALDWAPWMGDWFVSSSPRNGNTNAEGQWDQWVDLAIGILKDPLTALARPEAHAAAQGLMTCNFYSEANRYLTDEELIQRFGDPAPTDTRPYAEASRSGGADLATIQCAEDVHVGCDHDPDRAAAASTPSPPEQDEAEIGRAVIRSFRRTVPAEDMLKRVRPVGSDRPFGDSAPSSSGVDGV